MVPPSAERSARRAAHGDSRPYRNLGKVLLRLIVALSMASLPAAEFSEAKAEGDRYIPVEDPRLQGHILRSLAAELIAKGRPSEALNVLLTLETRLPDDRNLQIEIAQAEVRLGMYDQAIGRLNILGERHPEWPRPRVELALAFEVAGQFSAARAVLIDELGRNPPPPVRRNLEGRIRSLEDRMPFVGRFSIGVIPDSNVTGGTHNSNVEFLGLPFQVNDDARAKSGVRADITAGGTLRTAWRENTRLVASIDLEHSQPLTKAGTPAANARLALGALVRGKKWSALTGIAVQPFAENGELDRHELSWFATGGRHLAGPIGLGGSLILTKGIYAENTDRDFAQWEMAIGPRFKFGQSTVLQLAGIAGHRNAEVDSFSYERRGGSAGLIVAPGNGYRFMLSGAVIRDRYREIPFGFDRLQEDLVTVARARLVKGDLVIGGFSPSFGVGYNETRSNIDIYDKRGYSIELGLARPY
jgi:tetratricopeptide (TPR) repeat protein